MCTYLRSWFITDFRQSRECKIFSHVKMGVITSLFLEIKDLTRDKEELL